MNLFIFVWQAILTKNKFLIIKKTIKQTDIVPITFGVVILKERNSEKVNPKQSGVYWGYMYVKILMDSGSSASIIHKSYINKNNILTKKNFRESVVHNGCNYLFVA